MRTVRALAAAFVGVLAACQLAAAGAIVDAVSGVCVDAAAPGACALVDLLSSCSFDASDAKALTIFVPSDASLTAEEVALLQADARAACDIMAYHVVEGAHAHVAGRELELFSLYNGFPLEVSSRDGAAYLNLRSAASGSAEAPPRVVWTASPSFEDSHHHQFVVVHVIDGVATPLVTKAQLKELSAAGAQEKSTGRSFLPWPTGFQGAIGGSTFFTRNALGQVYIPFLGFWLNIFEGYSNNPGLYCASVRCKGGFNAGARTGGDVGELEIPESVVAAAVATPDLSILVDAVLAAGLDGPLSDPDAVLTVLAPTNDAFVALLGALGLDGLDDIPVDVLTQVLLYHVIPDAAVDSATLIDLLPTTLDTLEGGSLGAALVDGSIVFDGFASDATVVLPDVFAGSAVVHVIDAVLLPAIPGLTAFAPAPEPEMEPEMELPSVAEVASGVPDLSILVEALVAADFVAPLSEADATFTVFAPTNDAFVSLLGALGLDGLDDIPLDLLQLVLAYHVVEGVALDDLEALAASGEEVATVAGEPLGFSEGPTGEMVVDGIGSDANVIAEVPVGNSIVYVIDGVLLPQ